jgi:hypothetical protein
MRRDPNFKGFFSDFLGLVDAGNDDKFPYTIPDDKVFYCLFFQPTTQQGYYDVQGGIMSS